VLGCQTSFRDALPVWSAAPVAPWDGVYAEVYETEGVILERKHLHSARAHSFGRHAAWCDQVLPKVGSISRQHAALVHTRQGPVLMDLFSQHGTTLNNTKLAAGQPYFLHDGDIARFGGAGSHNWKFKHTGRPKREPQAGPIAPVVPPANYKIDEATEGGTKSGATAAADSAATAGESTAATAAALPGDKRKRESDSSSRKDARGEGGVRQGSSSSGGDSGLANPKTDRIRCRHLLVKHAGSRRPSSWRCETVTLTLAEARDKLDRLRAEILAGHPRPSEVEERLIALATRESDCSSAKHGGDLGFFTFNKMQPPFSKAAFQLKVGQITQQAVDTDSGVHIIFRKE